MSSAVKMYPPEEPVSIQEAFEAFDLANPIVFLTLVNLARMAQARGRRKLGIGALWERMRWELVVETNGGDDFKLNNNYRSRYARKILAECPDLDGIFETRELKS